MGKCEICGLEDGTELLVIEGAPKVCKHCYQKYQDAISGKIPIESVLTANTNPIVAKAIFNRLNRKEVIVVPEEPEIKKSWVAQWIKRIAICGLTIDIIFALIYIINGLYFIGFCIVGAGLFIFPFTYAQGEIVQLLTDLRNVSTKK